MTIADSLKPLVSLSLAVLVLSSCSEQTTSGVLSELDGSVKCKEVLNLQGTNDSYCETKSGETLMALDGNDHFLMGWIFDSWDAGIYDPWVLTEDFAISAESETAALEIWRQVGGDIVIVKNRGEETPDFCDADTRLNDLFAEARGDDSFCRHIPGARSN